MNILTFDTCLDKMYVSLGDEEKLFSSKIIETTQTTYHSAYLISTIKEILKENSLTPENIDLIATNIGPGSFTGIRACTTVARVMAQSLNIKAVGISSLEILSKINSSTSQLLTSSTLVALDARKEMAYVAIYKAAKEIMNPQVILLENLKEMIKGDDYFIITDDKLQPVLGGISYQQDDFDLGKFLLEITREKIAQNCETDWHKLLPLYIQPPAVSVKK